MFVNQVQGFRSYRQTVSSVLSRDREEVPGQVQSSSPPVSGALLSRSLSQAFRQQQHPASTLQPARGMAAAQATKFLRDKQPPKGKREQRRMRTPAEIVSFGNNGLGFTNALESLRNSCRMSGKVNAVDVTRSRKVNGEFLLYATRMR